jgi:ABC-type polar amino acid transport system ATPase subunit
MENNEMSINRVEIKDFLVFKGTFSADFDPGVNVFIGGNGTGKTTLLRALTFAVNEQGSKLLNAIATSNTEDVLYDVYHAQLNKLIIELTDVPQSLAFVPSAFDVNFMIKTNRKITIPSPTTNILMKTIREITNIETTETKDSFRRYIIRNDNLGKILVEQEASGYLKLDILFQMLKNGWVEKDAILLWDEPENSLNPELVPVLVDILLKLSKNGVQVFIATHDYNFARYFDVRKDRSVPIMFHNLTKTQQGIQCDSAPEYLSVPNNLLEKASEELFDAVVDSAMEGQGDVL